jgi:hypothetical protein
MLDAAGRYRRVEPGALDGLSPGLAESSSETRAGTAWGEITVIQQANADYSGHERRTAVRRHGLGYNNCELGEHKAGEHLHGEAVSQEEVRSQTARGTGKHFEGYVRDWNDALSMWKVSCVGCEVYNQPAKLTAISSAADDRVQN